MKALLIGMGTAVLLSACTMGIQPGGDFPTVSYTVPRSYQTVYLRVQNQADECLRGKKQYDVHATVDPAMQTGTVAVRAPIGGVEVARSDIEAIDSKHTRVTHTVWGPSPWDERALAAMRHSVVMDMSVCVVYK